MNHWWGLTAAEDCRTACGISEENAQRPLYCFGVAMFGKLVQKEWHDLCPECVRQFHIEWDRPPPLHPAIVRVQCEFITKPKTAQRPVGGEQCRILAIKGTVPIRCWRHEDLLNDDEAEVGY